jgi:hypothetical protein
MTTADAPALVFVMLPTPPLIAMPPEAVAVIVPAPEFTVPVSVSAPVLVTVTLPPPLSPIPVTVSGAAALVRLTFPLAVFVALKLPTVFAFVSVVPPTELVVSKAVVPNVPLPEIVPLDVAVIAPDVLLTAAFTARLFAAPVFARVTVPLPPAVTAAPIVSAPVVAVRLIVPLAAVVIAPVVVRLPVFVTDTLPPPLSLIPVTVSVAAVLVRLNAPLIVLVPWKVPTVFAPLSVVPFAEVVVNVPEVTETTPAV